MNIYMSKYENMIIPAGKTVTMNMLIENSLAGCDTAPDAPCAKAPWGCKTKKDENPMNYASATVVSQDTSNQEKIRFLTSQLYDAYADAKLALQRKFGLEDDASPETNDEVVARITAGLFVINEKYKDKKGYASLSYFRWRDPKAVEDKVGYEAAKAPLKAAFRAADRTIRILDPEAGLKALQDFEAAQAPK